MGASLITKRRAEPETTEKFTKPLIHPEHYESVVVDSRYQPLTHLLVHIEGANWKVNYYSKVLNEHTALAGQNMTKSPAIEQYKKINNFILKVDSPLQWQQDEETKQGKLEGSAVIYPPLIPNTGDMFVGDIGDGRSAIFEIKNSTKLSAYKQSVYQIEYSITGYATGTRLADLENKVIDDLFFSMDFLEHGQNPIITDEKRQLVNAIDHYYPMITKTYLHRYHSTRYRVMILPRDDKVIYDHFLTKTVYRWFSSDDYPPLTNMRLIPVMNAKVMDSKSIYDLLETQDVYGFPDIFTKVGVSGSGNNWTYPKILSPAFIGFDMLIYPKNPRYMLDYNDKYHTKTHIAPAPVPEFNYTKATDKEFKYQDRDLVHEIDLNESYVFTEAFYENDPDKMSQIELMTRRYLNKDYILSDVMFALIESWYKWDTIQQFYLTPILLMLMRASKRGL